MKPAIGKKAPAFKGLDQDGHTLTLKDFTGKKLALYFYPKDLTATCTVEACNLRDHIKELQKHGISIVGVSPDEVKQHVKFADKYQLPFPLLADTDHKIAEAYGVWDWKKFMGKTYMGILRTTFLINEKGILAHIIDKVNSKEHSQQILDTWGLS